MNGNVTLETRCQRSPTDENDAILVQQFRQFWILRRMTPSGPDGLHLGSLGNVQDQLNIGVVVVVRSARHWHILIGQPDIFYSQSDYSLTHAECTSRTQTRIDYS